MEPESDVAATEDRRLEFDEQLPALGSMLSAFAREIDGRMEHGDAVSWTIESIRVELPLELEIGDGIGPLSIGATTPLLNFATSFAPVFHRATIVFARTEE
jgi:hypothetical protein